MKNKINYAFVVLLGLTSCCQQPAQDYCVVNGYVFEVAIPI